MIIYEENDAVSSGIIFKGFTPAELKAGPYYLVSEIFREFKFCFHHNFVFTRFLFCECSESTIFKRSCYFWKAVLAFRAHQNMLPRLRISLHLGIEWLKFPGLCKRE